MTNHCKSLHGSSAFLADSDFYLYSVSYFSYVRPVSGSLVCTLVCISVLSCPFHGQPEFATCISCKLGPVVQKTISLMLG